MTARLVAAVLVLLLGNRGPAAARSKSCPGGRFLVEQGPLLMGEPPTCLLDTVVLDGRRVSLANVCPPVRAELTRSRAGMQVKAAWPSCSGLAGTVRLKAHIDGGCWRMVGIIKVRRLQLRRTFTATRVATCGNGIREADEQCDDGNTTDGDCCSASCLVEAAPDCAPARCRANGDCPGEAYCAKALGECRGEGVCQQQPGACIGVLEPVCGCDGRTYINACEAARGGTGLRSPGHCSRGCGTIAGIPCPEGSFCDHPPGTCEVVDAGGVCVPVPEACIQLFRPVCGCDGRTYDNDCERRAAQVQKAHDSPCGCAPIQCEPGAVPVDTDGDGCPEVCLVPGLCASNAECPEGAFCAGQAGHCEGRGACVARPQSCPRIFDPVCGCDRRTYPNACVAAAAGVRVASPGPCPCFSVLCWPGTRPVDRDGDGCPDDCLAPCEEACDCYLNPSLKFTHPCLALCPTCGNFWVCEAGFCEARCGPIPPGQDQCPAPPPCTTNADCEEGQFCGKPGGACDARGTCVPRPEQCPPVREPVCGCDGTSYENACEAARAGVSLAARGACGEVCGTIVGIPCPQGEFCEFPPGTCEGADLAGMCLEVPVACLEVFLPVCGCDGRTYGNDCTRRAVQVQKAHDGPCECVPITCRQGTLPHDTDGDGCADTCLPGPCTSNADCAADSYCAAEPVSASPRAPA